MKKNHTLQDYNQWNLPENAKARLGKGKIQEIAYSPDGNLLAVASSIGIWLYDTDTDEDGNLLTEHEHTTSVSFSPNGRILASGGPYYDNTFRLWDLKTGKHIKTLTGHRNNVENLSFSDNKIYRIGGVLLKSRLSFSGNGRFFASCGRGGISVWNMETGKHIKTLTRHTDSIHSITFSPDSGLLVSGSEDNTLRLWNIRTGECLKILTGHTDWVSSVSFCGNSPILASASYDQTVRLWDVQTGKHIKTLTGHTAPVTDISFIENNYCLASASYDQTVRLWDMKTGKHTKTFTGHTELVLGVSYSRNRDTLASASMEEVRLWDMKTGKHTKTFTGYSNDVRCLSFSADDHILASASSTAVQLWNVKTGKHIKTFTEPSNYLRLSFSNNSSILAIAGHDESGELSLWLWDVKTGKYIKKFTGDKNSIESLVFSDGDHILASASPTEVQLWGVRTGKYIKKFTEPRDHLAVFAKNISFSNDGSILAAGGMGREVWLWDVETGKRINTLIHGGWVSNISFNTDGSILSSIAKREVWLWDVKTGKHIKTLTHTDHVDRVCFSSDNRTLATRASYGRIVQLWDMKTGKHIKTLTGHVNEITDIVFNSNGKILATGSQDGTVLLWEIDLVENNSIFAEEKTEFQNRTSQIQQICEERGITTLIHFTRIENLQSILQEGLLGRSLLEARGQDFLFNDDDRADGHKEAVCLSISFPNYQMFYSIREQKKETQEANDSQWVVLLLDAKVLWELECAFCQRNAAHKSVTSILLEDRKRSEALKGIFEDFYDIRHQDLLIPQNYSTHPQAEVLVFDPIPVRYIKAIHFQNETVLEEWRYVNTGHYSQTLSANRQYFDARKDYEVWRPKNFDNEGIPLSYTAKDSVDDIPLADPTDDENDIPF